ncbi:Hsp20/alpha crystallin family protein [Zooshikella harenae]|uniref:Hsp20/alpha crystallin family protein n=1 Tax=Zooshikella harenae TaxID=2827238 RepID=A0ABS5ZDD2_9GAMM|nr:Hsp20/alpha crystallin family protein [Zooshikella harenae]MBU2711970.1 Hsp20/alpha crystallin family protein [Zooshikella harenae]
MSMVPWNPFSELETLLDRYQRLSGKSTQSPSGREAMKVNDWSPAVDISETAEEYLIKAELPEIRKEDVKVTVEEGVLTIQGERKYESEDKNRKHHRVERFYGSFARSFHLPEDTDTSAIRAEFADGMLNLHLPKMEKPTSRSVEIDIS